MNVGKIAATATRHQNFLANLVSTLKYNDTKASLARRHSAHEAGCAASNNNDICLHAATINDWSAGNTVLLAFTGMLAGPMGCTQIR